VPSNKMKSIVYRKIILVICCMSSAIALTFDRSVEVSDVKDLLQAQKTCMGIAPAVILGCIIFFTIQNRDAYIIKGKKIMAFVAVILSQCWWIGNRLISSFEIISLSKGGILQWFIVSVGWFFVIWSAGLFLFNTLDGTDFLNESISDDEKKKWICISFSSCACVWLLYYIVFFPGIVTADSFRQISQALGFSPLSNHHPFLHTLLESLFIRPAYNLLHNTEYGIAAFLLFQLLIMSLIIAYSQFVLCELGTGRKTRIVILLFYAINPLFGMYSITMWKDVWMGMMLLLYLLLLIKTVYLKNNSDVMLAFLAMSVLGVFFSKATGIAMILFSLIALVLVRVKDKGVSNKPIIVIAVTVLISLSIQSVAINLVGVIPTESRESKSVPLQQIARTVKYHGDELSDEEKTTINEILPYDNLAENYKPWLSDPVKDTFNEDNFNKDKGKYIKLWLRLGEQYPDTYIRSFMENTYGYWYPDTDYWVVTTQCYGLFFTEEYSIDSNSENFFSDEYTDKYHMSDKFFVRREKICERIFLLRKLPGMSLLFSIGMYFWIYLVIAAWSLREKHLYMLVPMAIAFAVFVSCLISPLYCEMRYGYPAVILLPIVFILALRKEPENG